MRWVIRVIAGLVGAFLIFLGICAWGSPDSVERLSSGLALGFGGVVIFLPYLDGIFDWFEEHW
jgi:hypothetical protein